MTAPMAPSVRPSPRAKLAFAGVGMICWAAYFELPEKGPWSSRVAEGLQRMAELIDSPAPKWHAPGGGWPGRAGRRIRWKAAG